MKVQSSWVSTLAIVNTALRSSEAQGLLAELASMPNISLVASMDHVNTPLLWDKQMAARFDWLYFDVTNYTPYYFETANVPSLLIGRRQVSVCFHAVTLLSTSLALLMMHSRICIVNAACHSCSASTHAGTQSRLHD